MFNLFKKKEKIIEAKSIEKIEEIDEKGKIGSFLNIGLDIKLNSIAKHIAMHGFSSIQRNAIDDLLKISGIGMDDSQTLKSQSTGDQSANTLLLSWYDRQGFIGWNACAIIYQHWLVSKVCAMPARDAVRNGYEITVNDGTEVDKKVIDTIRKMDVKYKINKNMREFITMGRVYGIRIAMFKVESDDPDFYKMPFNIDSIKPGSYKGIAQIDPNWVAPQLDNEAAGDPGSIHFLEPTWWRIGNQDVHRSHLMIFRNGELPDILKPTYFYGGIPITQLIYEKTYNAERSGNELPLLLMTKRTDVLKTDTTIAISNPGKIIESLNTYSYYRDNFGTKVIDLNDEMTRLDTTLSDADQVVMSLYQIVAAAANVPVTKLFGTMPKGFNATGESDEANYHEELKSMQTNDLTPLLERHHLLLIHSEIAPKFGINPFEITIEWKQLDEMTSKEVAEVNKLKADTGLELIQSGSISAEEERQRIINDPSSGYSGISDEIIESENEE